MDTRRLSRPGLAREHLALLASIGSHNHRAPPVEGADHAAFAQDFQCSPHGHLGHAVGLGKLKLARQTTPARELAPPDPLGKVVRKLHIDELGSIPLWHMINGRAPLTCDNAQLLP
jgi:hypothetical protein